MFGTDGPRLAAAKRLLDAAKDAGFTFVHIAPGPDGPLRGTRETREWTDHIYIGGFTDSCTALRRRRSSLVVPHRQPVAARVDGDAIEVLHTVVADSPA